MDAKLELKKLAEKIDEEVTKVMDEEFETSKNISPIINELLEDTTTIPAYGGKRIRGAFLYYSYIMHGGKDLKEALKATAFIELMHAYLLIHDDIMDQAPLRRGFETIHSIYRRKYKNVHHYTNGMLRDHARHYGESMAINAGDILCHLGMLVLSRLNFPAENKLKAIELFHRKIVDTGYGQVIDVNSEFVDVDKDYVLKVHLYKTAYYTYQAPLHVGAILAGADEKELKHLTNYATPAGVAFQIQDDIIDLFSEDQETGKTPGTDIREGKKTLLIIKACEKASEKDQIILDNALGNKNLDKNTLDIVKKIIVDTGSLDFSIKTAQNLLKDSTIAIKESKRDNEGRDFLIGINEYMLNRKF